MPPHSPPDPGQDEEPLFTGEARLTPSRKGCRAMRDPASGGSALDVSPGARLGLGMATLGGLSHDTRGILINRCLVGHSPFLS